MHKKIYTLIKLLLLTALLFSFSPAHTQDVDEQYQQTIESADKYFEQGDYLNAKASYQVASQLKPDEQYPKDRLRESIGLLRVQMQEMAVYNEKLAYADRLYQEGSWDNAILAYEEAGKMMPSQEYPGRQISLIRNLQAGETENEATYSSLVREGDDLFAAEDYAEAINKYEEASALYPNRQDTKNKINAANDKLADIAAQQSGYEKAISEAEMYHARKDYEKELSSYQLATELKPEEPLPQVKIRELNEFLRKYEAYNNFVAEGDDLYINQQFAEAKIKYEKALEVLPDESYPKEIIIKINSALSEKTEKDKAAYEEALSKADALYNQEDYESAMLAYSDALRFWPDGDHAKQRLGSISEIMALKKAQEEAYANAITLADKLFASKEYQAAKDEYRKAADINPFEQYPKVRINEIDLVLAEIQNKLEQYESVILGADKLFNVGDYAEARIQYLRAQEILSQRSYPEDQIRMIDDILGKEMATQEAYLAAIARGDEHFGKREWEDAKVDFVEATDLIPVEQYPKDKITEINNILAELKADQDTYTLALKTADQLFTDKQYAAALLEYRKAADIFQEESYPREKIEEIDQLLGEQERLAQLEADYNEAIADAESQLSGQNYAEARAAFELALTYKPGEAYPGEKIAEIDGILSEQARLLGIETSYKQAIAAADLAMEQNDYLKAKSEYERAAGIKADEIYPTEKIVEINAILAEQARLAGIDASYQAAIVKADALFLAANYTEAKSVYLEAKSIKAEESYPDQKIAEIDAIFMAEAAEVERLAHIAAQYAQAISDADALLAQKEYLNAKEKYGLALSLKPGENYPSEKITEIDGILGLLEQQRILDENYAAAIASADRLFDDASYTQARTEYEKAAVLKAGETYPAERIAEIDAILSEQARLQGIEVSYSEAISAADSFFANDQYTEARAEYTRASGFKPDEEYPLNKISEIDAFFAEIAALNEQYEIAIGTADTYYNENQYPEAREAYVRAQGIKPGEAYPAERIATIDNILANLEAQRLIDEGYANAIALGDNHFTNKEYEQAKAEFMKAVEFKADQQYPKDKIAEIDGILAEQARLHEIEESYSNAIANADGFFNNEQYTEARTSYMEALAAKPEDVYALRKVSEIDGILGEMARLQKIEDSYNNAISTADAAFNAENYISAREAYTAALGFKPAEQYPVNKIAEIDAIIAEIAARKKAIDDSYAQAIIDADDHLDRGAYLEAIQEYEKATGIKPEETYPKEKIAEINGRLSELQAERQQAYNTAIAQADSYYDMGNYRNAKGAYQTAVTLKPDESYARERLDEVTVLYMAELETLKVEYRKVIADADNYFREKIYDGAIENYRIASGILPDETYPGKMISRITKVINDNAITDVNKLAQIIPNNTDKRFPFNELPVNVRKENYILIKARNVSDHEFKMLVNFGRDNSKNGGVVLKVPKGETSRDYIIRIGALYKWFSEDNNWLGIYPEGGDIEVALIRISKSD